MADDLGTLDAVASAALVASGKASPTELVDAAIARVQSVNRELNAVIHERFEKARREAAGTLPDGPFRGVPLLVKDLMLFQEGEPYHGGFRMLRRLDYRGRHDSFVTTRLRRAGFVIIGRTNVPENGMTVTTESLAYGPARNPWNTGHSTGGSSGGSAAAVAAHLTPAAHASDGGGSIRVPASECGVVGLKSSRGRVSLGPELGDMWLGAAVHGCVTRTVRDTAAILDVLAGYEPGDPYTAPPLPRPLAAEVGRQPGALRVGLLDAPLFSGLDDACRAAVQKAGALLGKLGHHVEASYPEALGDEAFPQRFGRFVASFHAADVAAWETELGFRPGPGDVEPSNLHFAEIGASLSATQFLETVAWLQAWARRVATFWSAGGFDLLVTPVIAKPPPALGWLSDPDEGGARFWSLAQYTAQFNVTGQPAISLPLHWTSDGLPIGVQLVAAYGREDVLVQVAAQLEQAEPWATRVPRVHA